MMLDGIENAQARISGISREQDHFDPRRISGCTLVQGQQLAYHLEGHARRQRIVFVVALECAVSLHAFTFIQSMALFKVEECA